MWLWLSVLSAFLLGFYDVAKKKASARNSVLHILFYTTAISSLFFLPLLLSSIFGWSFDDGSLLEIPSCGWKYHLVLAAKAVLVSFSWITGLLGLKHLPITIVGPIKASRPVFIILFSMLLFGERLTLVQWVGVIISITALWMLSNSGKREGIDFLRDKWVWCMVAAVLSGVASALLDKKILATMNPVFVQGWCNVYITAVMGIALLFTKSLEGGRAQKFRWDWAILGISVFITLSDFCYFFSLYDPASMISVVSMLRRSSVIITFVCGALIFKEGNLKGKAVSLLLLLAGMAILLFGSR